MTYFAVGLGGALGAMLRVFLLPFLPGMILGIPAQILIINFLGCFVMGLLVHVMAFY